MRTGLVLLIGCLLLGPASAHAKREFTDETIVKNSGKEKSGKTLRCNFHKTKACRDVESGSKLDSAGQAVQYCNYLKASDHGCTAEEIMAIGYTAMAATCWTACGLYLGGVTAPAAAVVGQVCAFGSIALGAADIVTTGILKHQAKEAADEASQVLTRDYGLGGPIASTAVGALAETLRLTSVGLSHAAGTGLKGFDVVKDVDSANATAACLTAAMNTYMAFAKWHNKHQIVLTSEQNYAALKDLKMADKPSGVTGDSYKPGPALLSGGGGGGSPPPIADTRSANVEVPVADDKVDLARVGESYATADTSKFFGNPRPDVMNKAFDALNKYAGLTPEGLRDSLESNGVGGTLAKFTGDNETGRAMANIIKDMEGKVIGDLQQGSPLAFERTSAGGAGGGKKDGMDLSSLFGARGPAGDGAGGVKDIKFGGFSNDIWHAGSTLSIFEIVSRKTQTVSSRVGR